MPLVEMPGMRSVKMGRLEAALEWRGDVAYVRPREPLGDYPRTLIGMLDRWAAIAPDRLLFADRGPDGEWRRLTYAEAREHSRAIAQYLINLGLSEERPLVILSGNGIEHALLALGAMRAGIPYAPVSPPYSLVAKDFGKLRHIFELLTPGLVFSADGAPFAAAIEAVRKPGMVIVNARHLLRGAVAFDTLLRTRPELSAGR